jgi:hypothetical protein
LAWRAAFSRAALAVALAFFSASLALRLFFQVRLSTSLYSTTKV